MRRINLPQAQSAQNTVIHTCNAVAMPSTAYNVRYNRNIDAGSGTNSVVDSRSTVII